MNKKTQDADTNTNLNKEPEFEEKKEPSQPLERYDPNLEALRTRFASLVTDPGGQDSHFLREKREEAESELPSRKLSTIEEAVKPQNFIRTPHDASYEFCSSRKVSLDESVESYQTRRKSLQRHKQKYRAQSDRSAGRWQKQEHAKFIQGLKLYGRDWKKVEGFLGTRTGAQIRSHAQKFFNRIQRQFNAEDPAEFVTSGEFQRRLAQGYIPQSAQESTFLYCPPSFNDTSYPSNPSPRNASVSTFKRNFQEAAAEPSIKTRQYSRNQKMKREIAEQEKEENSQKKAEKMSQKVQSRFSPSEFEEPTPDSRVSSKQLEEIRPIYEEMISSKASLMTHLQYNTNIHHSIDQIEIFMSNLKNFYDLKIVPVSQKTTSQEVLRIKERVEESLKELEKMAVDLKQGTRPIQSDLALRGSAYFDNVVLPNLGCRNMSEFVHKYPRISDWSNVRFSSPQ